MPFPDTCERCIELRDWTTAHGPAAVLERLRTLLGLTAQGFTEVPHRPTDGWRVVEWSQLSPALLTSTVVQNGWMDARSCVESSMTIRCDACGRQYSQSWAFERGYERWSVTEPTGRDQSP